MQRLTENTIEDIVNRSVNHKNMNNHNDLNINNKYKVLFVCLGQMCRLFKVFYGIVTIWIKLGAKIGRDSGICCNFMANLR